MKLVIHPPVEAQRLKAIVAAAGPMQVVNAADERVALAEIVDADAFFGKLTPTLLAAATRLRWVQSPTASLEHYIFPELVAHPAVLTNMRGLYGDMIAEHVLGVMLCFTRNLHTYIRNQAVARWSPLGGEAARASFAAGPGENNDIDRAHRVLGDLTLGIVGLGQIGREIARQDVGLRDAHRGRRSAGPWAGDRRGIDLADRRTRSSVEHERFRRHRRAAHASRRSSRSGEPAVPSDETQRRV